MARRGRDVWWWGAALAVLAGGVARFATLGVQSMWLDEAITHRLVTRSFAGMLSALPHSESTPPLYYVLDWPWVRLFGSGAVGMRSLSALFGTLTIIVVAAIARRLGGTRAAFGAAALAAANPLLIWYSQEARAYALVVLLCSVTVLCLLRSDWRGFALAAALALATHYFAIFVVVPELAWLAWRHGRRSRTAALALGGVLAVGAALLPLAIVQASGNRARFISATSLGSRVVAVPKQFLIGYATPHATLLTIAAALAAAALVPALRRRDGHMLLLATIVVGVPVALAVVGIDYVITRNVIMGMVPLVVLAGLASARTRAGAWLVAVICVTGVVAFVGVETTAADQRDDWRGVAEAIGPATLGPRALVVNPSDGPPALELYLPARRVPSGTSSTIQIREIDVLDVARDAPDPTAAAPFSPFTATVIHTSTYTLVRYVSAAPATVFFSTLAALSLQRAAGASVLTSG